MQASGIKKPGRKSIRVKSEVKSEKPQKRNKVADDTKYKYVELAKASLTSGEP